MAKGARSGGIDFDDLFDPDIIGDGPSVPNLRSGGTPLRYAKLSYGTKRADVGYRQSGVDVSNLWAAKGTARYALPINGQTFSAGYQSPTNEQGTAFATITVVLSNNGTYSVLRGFRTGTTTIASGTWHTFGGVPTDFDVRMIAQDVSGSAAGGYVDTGYLNGGASASRSVSVQSNSVQEKEGIGRIRVIISRKNQGDGGIVSDTTVNTIVSAAGWT